MNQLYCIERLTIVFLFTFAETKSTCTEEGIINFQDKYLQRNFRRYKADRVFSLVERLRNAKVNRKQSCYVCTFSLRRAFKLLSFMLTNNELPKFNGPKNNLKEVEFF